MRRSVRCAAQLASGVLITAVVTVGLAACAAESPELPTQPATVDTGSHSLAPQQTPTPVPSLDQAQTRGLESTPWQLVSAKGSELTIRYVAGGGCSTFKGIRVSQGDDSVEIWTTVQTDDTARACAAYLALGATKVHLRAPLGDRALLHAPVSKNWTTYTNNF